MISYFKKFKGTQEELPKRAASKTILLAWIGSFLTIAILMLLSTNLNETLILGSFGASCVLVFAFPKSPFSQPRNVILGHCISSFTGLCFLHFVGEQWWSLALALASAIAFMLITRTVHPPAGSNPVIVFLAGSNWQFLITPTLLGSIILVIIAVFYLNLKKDQQYPSYWF